MNMHNTTSTETRWLITLFLQPLLIFWWEVLPDHGLFIKKKKKDTILRLEDWLSMMLPVLTTDSLNIRNITSTETRRLAANPLILPVLRPELWICVTLPVLRQDDCLLIHNTSSTKSQATDCLSMTLGLSSWFLHTKHYTDIFLQLC